VTYDTCDGPVPNHVVTTSEAYLTCIYVLICQSVISAEMSSYLNVIYGGKSIQKRAITGQAGLSGDTQERPAAKEGRVLAVEYAV
jgi:hypothetical protein